MTEPARPTVGRQLRNRRLFLNLAQDDLAGRIGIRTKTVSNVENDRSRITLSRRGDWERELLLKPGTISRAYEADSPIEPLDDDPQASARLQKTHQIQELLKGLSLDEQEEILRNVDSGLSDPVPPAAPPSSPKQRDNGEQRAS
ncbi:helix-turn-helix transcriptional regulator [Streptomyces synnematoformans]